MTGTDLCVNKPVTVPVIFEPPCIKNAYFESFCFRRFVLKVQELKKYNISRGNKMCKENKRE